jgi:methionine sulfoxide reductase heme-binding subunit
MKAIKWILRIGIWAWACYWIAQIFIGDLGASPALELNHQLGIIALTVFTANLTVGIIPPLRKLFGSERRFWGVSGFLIIVIHVFFYFVNEAFEPKAFVQVYTKLYLIFALLAFVILLALAATSNNFSVRKLGPKRWKILHRFVYLAQWLVMGHVLNIEKIDLTIIGPWLFVLLVAQIMRLGLFLFHRYRPSATPTPR